MAEKKHKEKNEFFEGEFLEEAKTQPEQTESEWLKNRRQWLRSLNQKDRDFIAQFGEELWRIKYRVFLNPLSGKEVKIIIDYIAGGVAGYSKDGSKIYIDPLVPEWMYKPLIAHELFEMTCILVLGEEYEAADEKATEIEMGVCVNLSIEWKKYDDEFHKIMELQKQRVPQPKGPDDMYWGSEE